MNCPHYFVLLDDAQNGNARLYQQHTVHNIFHHADLGDLDDCLQAGFARKEHAVILADYTWGRKLHGFDEHSGSLNIFWFAQLKHLDAEATEEFLHQAPTSPSGIAQVQSNVQQSEYRQAIDDIHRAIRRGDAYQINYTTRLHFRAYGTPKRLYQRLKQRQAVPYGALAYLPISKQNTWILSFSPELFLRLNGENIQAEPMKGTAPICDDGKDEQRRQALQQDSKNRAENVMIVDLLRNDLGHIAQTGSVHVPQLFTVQSFGKVWQMTSLIEAKLRTPHTIVPIFQAAFPCGSITGAPKRKSMELIEQIEQNPRGIYTGSLGFIEAHPQGYSGCLNVLIRTLELHENGHQQYDGIMGVGSGIVIGSQADAEWQECQDKAHFLQDLPPELGLIETLRIENRQSPLLAQHIQRMSHSAQQLGFAISEREISHFCQHAIRALPEQGIFRLRIHLDRNGKLSQQNQAINIINHTLPTVAIHPQRLPENDFLRRHKTDFRPIYQTALAEATAQNLFDFLFFDTQERLLEGARSNIFIRKNQQWYTPATHADFLNGIMRQTVLSKPQTHLATDTITECDINLEMLITADEIRLCNGLRGIFPVYFRLPEKQNQK